MACNPDPTDVVHDSSRAESQGVDRATGGCFARVGNPHVTGGMVCRACLSLGRSGYCHVCVGLQPVNASQPVSTDHGVVAGAQGPGFLVGETSDFGENPLMGSEVQGFFTSGSFPQDFPIFTSGSCSPLYLSKEVHSILADFGSEHIHKGGVDFIQEDLLVSCFVLPTISNTSLGGGTQSGGGFYWTQIYLLQVLLRAVCEGCRG